MTSWLSDLCSHKINKHIMTGQWESKSKASRAALGMRQSGDILQVVLLLLLVEILNILFSGLKSKSHPDCTETLPRSPRPQIPHPTLDRATPTPNYFASTKRGSPQRCPTQLTQSRRASCGLRPAGLLTLCAWAE